jgi:hypothetical protein
MEHPLTPQEQIDKIRQLMIDGEEKHNAAMAKHDAAMAKLDAKLDKIAEQYGGFQNNLGHETEDYFFRSLEHKKVFAGIKFNEIRQCVKPTPYKGVEDEYDIVMINGDTIALIEAKTHANPNDILNVLKKKDTFRILAPMYSDYKVVLGLATKALPPLALEKAKELGIAVIVESVDSGSIEYKNEKLTHY